MMMGVPIATSGGPGGEQPPGAGEADSRAHLAPAGAGGQPRAANRDPGRAARQGLGIF